MERPSLSADSRTIIEWCQKNSPPTHFYTERLGLPQAPTSKQEDEPQFEGHAASICHDFYKTVIQQASILNDESKKKGGKARTVAEQLNSMKYTTFNSLKDYGHHIWGTSEPWVTRIHKIEYPKRLKYSDKNDQERINLYLSCWITAIARKMTIDQARVHVEEDKDESSDFKTDEPGSIKKSRAKRKGSSTLNSNESPKKRLCEEEPPSNRHAEASTIKQGSRANQDIAETPAVAPCLSSPLPQQGMSNSIGSNPNTSKIRYRNEVQNAADAQNNQHSQNKDDTNSKQGAKIPNGETQLSTTNPIVAQPPLIHPNLTARSEQNKEARQHLRSKLGILLFTKTTRPNIPLFSTVNDMLGAAINADRAQLTEVYGEAWHQYKAAVGEWLQWLERLVQFHHKVGFTCELSDRDDFLLRIQGGVSDDVVELFFLGNADLLSWRSNVRNSEAKLAKDVASVFFHLADWYPWIPLSKLESRTLEWTENMLAWFE